MEFSKEIEAEVLRAYLMMWETYFSCDLTIFESLIDDDFKLIGTSETEICNNKAEGIEYFKSLTAELVGKTEFRNRKIEITPVEPLMLVSEMADIYALVENEMQYYSSIRISTFMKKRSTGWKVLHQHGSFPDMRVQEGETLAIEKISRENIELRDAVKRHTIELIEKNRELELETSLERVRAVALSMRKPEDLTSICEVLFEELRNLKIEGLRNAMINIHNDEKESFVNYDYSDAIGKSINHLAYTTHPVIEKQIRQIRSSDDAFSHTVFSGHELEEWKTFRSGIGEKDDPRMTEAKALHYYFYSIGTGAIGISTFAGLDDHPLDILKRFRNVFEFAYRRYHDVAQAEAQAREAQIELALERVRARAMAMQKSDELRELVAVIYDQLRNLGFTYGACGIVIMDAVSGDMDWWMSGFGEEGYPESYHIPYFNHRFYLEQLNHWKECRKFAVMEVSGDEKKAYDEVIFNHSEFSRIIPDAKKIMSGFEKVIFSNAYMKHGALSWGTESIDEDHAKILQRFAIVFEQSYTRFLDLQKAEDQAREAQVELALERVRARTMAMHQSSELAETAAVLFQQMKDLGFETWSTGFCIWKSHDQVEAWMSADAGGLLPPMMIPYKDEPTHFEIYKSYQRGEERHERIWEGEELEEHYERLRAIPSVKEAIDILAASGISLPEKQCYYVSFFQQGYLLNITKDPKAEAMDLTTRFAKVFSQTYTRFLDLQKAEAQARESQIETALEKVRARTMGMQKSDELKAVIQIIYDQFVHLGINTEHAGIILDYKQRDDMFIWIADHVETPSQVTVPYFDSPHWNGFNHAKENGLNFFAVNLNFEEKNNFYRKLFTYIPDLPTESKETILSYPGLAISTVLMEDVSLYIENFAGIPYSVEDNNTLMRFGRVFQQTYTRFKDLENAEAQAREAQVEAALERIRSRSMAMHKSDELQALSFELVKQVQALGVKTWFCAFNIYDDDKKGSTEWGSNADGVYPVYRTPREGIFLKYYNIGETGEKFHVEEIGEDRCADHYEWLCTIPGVGDSLLGMKAAGIPFPLSQIDHVAYFKYGYILYITYEPVPESYDTFQRFAKVFEQTYTRFLDLKKSEAQAREAQIEAALEKVRSRSLAMHKSEEVQDVVKNVFERLKELNVEMDSANIAIFNEHNRSFIYWIASANQKVTNNFHIERWNFTLIQDLFTARDNGLDYWSKSYSFEEKNDWFNFAFSNTDFRNIPDDRRQFILTSKAYGLSTAFSKNTGVQVNNFSGKLPTGDQVEILKRFSKVFEQAYVRFLDLQKAEEQSREAQIEAALERVRSRTLAMQKSDELAETSAVLFRQLILLGIHPNRLYITILNGDEGNAEFWITDEDGTKVSSAFKAHLPDNASFKKMFEGWQNKQRRLLIDMQGEELEEYFRHLLSLNVPFKGGLTQQRRVQHLAYFSRGFIGLASSDEQPEETMLLLERFAGVFNLTFTRFNDLKQAEAQAVKAEEDLIELIAAKKKAEDALSILKSTQSQLIQAEKMASLGQLTAGIAHEIQNPLNFVNNFSDVSEELIEEAIGTRQEAGENSTLVTELLMDIKQNLAKINHHGKRADTIVKAMLQHSSTAAGSRELTDINKLLDEYTKLAFHAFRGKDSLFDVKLQTDFDLTIPQLRITPQEIGRVLLNVLNNAFYAAHERRKIDSDFIPEVIVETKKTMKGIEISVKDNGGGIPETIVNKIFQPFFTTKPTGQGTGLGLSLAYDIVKAHGGEIRVESEDGRGSVFIIVLPG